jgi:hypothetical protein
VPLKKSWANKINCDFLTEPRKGLCQLIEVSMKDKHKKHAAGQPEDKDILFQKDLIAGTSTFALPERPHKALETPDGKNNGAEPAVFSNQRKSRT